jgi:hypothetical protein
MEVSPSQLRHIGAALHDLATHLRAALAGDRTVPDDPAWATDAALRAQASAWDGYLAGLAARLADAGDRLMTAAEAYAAADSRTTVRYGRRLC